MGEYCVNNILYISDDRFPHMDITSPSSQVFPLIQPPRGVHIPAPLLRCFPLFSLPGVFTPLFIFNIFFILVSCCKIDKKVKSLVILICFKNYFEFCWFFSLRTDKKLLKLKFNTYVYWIFLFSFSSTSTRVCIKCLLFERKFYVFLKRKWYWRF